MIWYLLSQRIQNWTRSSQRADIVQVHRFTWITISLWKTIYGKIKWWRSIEILWPRNATTDFKPSSQLSLIQPYRTAVSHLANVPRLVAPHLLTYKDWKESLKGSSNQSLWQNALNIVLQGCLSMVYRKKDKIINCYLWKTEVVSSLVWL